MEFIDEIENIINIDSFDEIDEKEDVMDLVFVLDKSGSMYNLVDDTIGGYNSLIEKEKKSNPNAYVTLVLFDTEYKVIYERKPIREVEELTDDVYYASGCTALLDAVGTTINRLDRKVSGKILFSITTDGLENSSREFSRNDIKNMISNHDWEFLFLGANIDSYHEASTMGIKASHSANYDASTEGIAGHWRSISIASDRISNNISLDDGEWKRDLD